MLKLGIIGNKLNFNWSRSYDLDHNILYNLENKKMYQVISEEKESTIDITPSWVTCGEVIIMALQNPDLDQKGFDNSFEFIRDMAQKMDQANKIIRHIKSK